MKERPEAKIISKRNYSQNNDKKSRRYRSGRVMVLAQWTSLQYVSSVFEVSSL